MCTYTFGVGCFLSLPSTTRLHGGRAELLRTEIVPVRVVVHLSFFRILKLLGSLFLDGFFLQIFWTDFLDGCFGRIFSTDFFDGFFEEFFRRIF